MKYSASIAVLYWCSMMVPALAFTTPSNFQQSSTTTAFLGAPVSNAKLQTQQSSQRAATLRMDVEEPFLVSSSTNSQQRIPANVLQRYHVPIASLKTRLQIPREEEEEAHPSQQSPSPTSTIDDVLAQHGLPWKSSIDPSYVVPNEQDGLFYMPFFDWQIQFMKDNLTNLKVLPTESQAGEDLSYIESTTTAGSGSDKSKQQDVRMVTLCFQSDEYRKIRMTLYDAGNKTQVFTSLWYPAEEYNLPVLGVDLLQFNLDRHLCVVDFQPIMASEDQHAQSYEHLLQPIRDRYPSLQGQMTKRFYDETRHFSNQMLYSRFEELHGTGKQLQQESSLSSSEEEEEHPAYRDLFPAYQEYVQTHLSLIQSTPPSKTDVPKVKQGQADYDTYSADRDPAHAMFHRVFGPKFADAFVYDVLFSFSEGTERAA